MFWKKTAILSKKHHLYLLIYLFLLTYIFFTFNLQTSATRFNRCWLYWFIWIWRTWSFLKFDLLHKLLSVWNIRTSLHEFANEQQCKGSARSCILSRSHELKMFPCNHKVSKIWQQTRLWWLAGSNPWTLRGLSSSMSIFSYVPSSGCTFDEQLAGFERRCSLVVLHTRTWLRNQTGMIWKFGSFVILTMDMENIEYDALIYLGYNVFFKKLTLAKERDTNLSRPLYESGRNITTYCTSMSLAQTLPQNVCR